MSKFKTWLYTFMSGRYGADRLGQVLLWVCIALAFINIFVKSPVFYFLQLALLVWAMYRMLSRNRIKRRAENDAFMRFFGKIVGFFKIRRDMLRDRATHVYKKCPKCKAMLRLPKTQGSHTVRCPRCSERFDLQI